ncbi:MAG: hypothetical protein IKK24_00185 [Clostridia bacterium]|nr:hypothetical protein [Clostridia bacterium]
MNTVNVNFDKKTGLVKPLNSVCCAPYNRGQGPNQESIQKFFTAGNIPYCRLHDCCGAYGGTYYVDVPNIFRNFDADENDPASYDFYYTDEYITAIQNSGCEAYYRLGVTIEWGSKNYACTPPANFEKWARICEHIIMHYNQGWADGFNYNLKYWEIWNEPENPGNDYGKSMWDGTKEEFFDLYKTASKHLKKRFPELKIGGYGSCGFYAVTRDDVPESFKEFVTYFTDFLEMVKKENCPLDFFSWHIYTYDEKELLTHAKFARETLDKYGFTDTESHLNEWNIAGEGGGFTEKHTLEGASFNGAVLCMLQNTDYVDMAHYYCFSTQGRYNGFLDQNNGNVCPSWYPFVAFGKLYALKNSVETECDGEIYAATAKNDDEYGIMISNYSCDDNETKICIKGISSSKNAKLLFIKESYNLEEEFSFTVINGSEIKIKLPKHTVAYLEIT